MYCFAAMVSTHRKYSIVTASIFELFLVTAGGVMAIIRLNDAAILAPKAEQCF